MAYPNPGTRSAITSEVSAAWIAHAALGLLEGEGAVSSGTAVAFAEAQGLNLAKADSASY